jgi:hypothetical protein
LLPSSQRLSLWVNYVRTYMDNCRVNYPDGNKIKRRKMLLAVVLHFLAWSIWTEIATRIVSRWTSTDVHRILIESLNHAMLIIQVPTRFF